MSMSFDFRKILGGASKLELPCLTSIRRLGGWGLIFLTLYSWHFFL